MPEVQQDLRPTTPDEIAEALSFALRYDGRRRIHNGDTLMAWITAERLVAHLELLRLRPDEAPAGRNTIGAELYPARARPSFSSSGSSKSAVSFFGVLTRGHPDQGRHRPRTHRRRGRRFRGGTGVRGPHRR